MIVTVTNADIVLISHTATPEFNIPGRNPTWNASTWSSKGGQLVGTTSLDCHQLLWPGTASWPSSQKTILVTPKWWKFLKFTLIQYFPHPCWFLPYKVLVCSVRTLKMFFLLLVLMTNVHFGSLGLIADFQIFQTVQQKSGEAL